MNLKMFLLWNWPFFFFLFCQYVAVKFTVTSWNSLPGLDFRLGAGRFYPLLFLYCPCKFHTKGKSCVLLFRKNSFDFVDTWEGFRDSRSPLESTDHTLTTMNYFKSKDMYVLKGFGVYWQISIKKIILRHLGGSIG